MKHICFVYEFKDSVQGPDYRNVFFGQNLLTIYMRCPCGDYLPGTIQDDLCSVDTTRASMEGSVQFLRPIVVERYYGSETLVKVIFLYDEYNDPCGFKTRR